MARGTHRRETFPAAKRQIDGTNRSSGGTSGVFFNYLIEWRIRVEVDRLPQAVEMFWPMRPQPRLLWPVAALSRPSPGVCPRDKPQC